MRVAFAALLLLAGVPVRADSSIGSVEPAFKRAPSAERRCAPADAPEEPLFLEAERQLRAGDDEAARRAWMRFVKERPDSPFVADALLQLAQVMRRRGARDDAVKLYESVLLFPRTRCATFVRFLHASALAERGEDHAALEELVRVARDAEREDAALAAEARHLLVVTYSRVGRADRARAFFRRVSPAYGEAMLAAYHEMRTR